MATCKKCGSHHYGLEWVLCHSCQKTAEKEKAEARRSAAACSPLSNDTPETNMLVRESMNSGACIHRLAAKLTLKCEELERERNQAASALRELYDALVRYEGIVDGEAPPEHCRMMDRAASILFPENDKIHP